MNSIIQPEKDRKCYICRRSGALERHHCIKGTANRKIADREGLTVYLCPGCHRALHDKGQSEEELMIIAEACWISHNHSTQEEFRRLFGKNYI